MQAIAHKSHHGRYRVYSNCLLPLTDSTEMLPPCASMRLLVMFSPSPVPPNFLVALMSPCNFMHTLPARIRLFTQLHRTAQNTMASIRVHTMARSRICTMARSRVHGTKAWSMTVQSPFECA